MKYFLLLLTLMSSLCLAEESIYSGGHVMNALPPGSTLDDFIKQRVSSTNNTAQTPFENVEAEYGNKNLRTDLMWNR